MCGRLGHVSWGKDTMVGVVVQGRGQHAWKKGRTHWWGAGTCGRGLRCDGGGPRCVVGGLDGRRRVGAQDTW